MGGGFPQTKPATAATPARSAGLSAMLICWMLGTTAQTVDAVCSEVAKMTQYQISNKSETLVFGSEKDACEYLGVKRCSVASCYRRGSLCKGYRVTKLGDSFHRETNSRLHKIWESMLARCEYEKHPHYANYGGRGIAVCDKWHEYTAFRDWAMNNNYADSLTIDRIDNAKGYEPDNCR